MQDKLGRVIARGDTLALVGVEYDSPQGLRRRLLLATVVDTADFAIKLEQVCGVGEAKYSYFASVYENTSEMVIVQRLPRTDAEIQQQHGERVAARERQNA